jgi:hypothetical protein
MITVHITKTWVTEQTEEIRVDTDDPNEALERVKKATGYGGNKVMADIGFDPEPSDCTDSHTEFKVGEPTRRTVWYRKDGRDEEREDKGYLLLTDDGDVDYIQLCKLCQKPTPASTAHCHQGGYIGECCWDERLRASE